MSSGTRRFILRLAARGSLKLPAIKMSKRKQQASASTESPLKRMKAALQKAEEAKVIKIEAPHEWISSVEGTMLTEQCCSVVF